MRRTLLAGLALSATVIVLSLPGVAFAASGLPAGRVNGYTLDADNAPDGPSYPDTIENSAEGNPHQGFTTSTHKCSVCHAVHHAGPTGNGSQAVKLLRVNAGDTEGADACGYCHIDPDIAGHQVYGGDEAKYNGSDLPNAHNDFGDTPARCTMCHQVHAAQDQMTANSGKPGANNDLGDYLLSKGDFYDTDADPDPENGTGEPLYDDSFALALSKWCTKCHGTAPELGDGSYWPGVFEDSHPVGMSATANNVTAFGGSQYCISCHSDTKVAGVPTASAFPHYTDGVRFLETAAGDTGGSAGATPAESSKVDGVCLRCHRNGATRGVGLDF